MFALIIAIRYELESEPVSVSFRLLFPTKLLLVRTFEIYDRMNSFFWQSVCNTK